MDVNNLFVSYHLDSFQTSEITRS